MQIAKKGYQTWNKYQTLHISTDDIGGSCEVDQSRRKKTPLSKIILNKAVSDNYINTL